MEEIKSDEVLENNNNIKAGKARIFFGIVIVLSVILILVCAGYLINSFTMIKKYDVDSFKLDKFEIPTFNSAVKSKKKLVYASEKNGIITLKYDIKKIHLNDVYAYLEKLSLKGYAIVNLEDLYMRAVNTADNIQVRIKVASNHLVFEYNVGIDYNEETKIGNEKTKDSKEATESKNDKKEAESQSKTE